MKPKNRCAICKHLDVNNGNRCDVTGKITNPLLVKGCFEKDEIGKIVFKDLKTNQGERR